MFAKQDTESRRVAVVTGASAGIGKAAAKALVEMGWDVIGLGRDQGRSQSALAELRRHAPDVRVEMIVADLSVMAEARLAAREIARLTDRVDALLNNAGGIGKKKVLTIEGNEAIFAGNHLGPFLLTLELLPLLRAAASRSGAGSSRVINVSSSAADMTPGLDWDDVQMLERHVAPLAYCNAKLANLMFTRALANRLRAEGIRVNAMHPGVADTAFSSYGDESIQQAAASMKDVTVSPEQAADTLIWLATSPEVANVNGGYFYNRQPAEMHRQALDDDEAERLWVASEALVARSRG